MRLSIKITEDQVWAEKDRRWALGFDYKFPDERGTHRFGTTKKDLEDWNKVTVSAQTALNLGQPEARIPIWTDTGVTSVTALEWQGVLATADVFFQNVIAYAGALIAYPPIPVDYTDDKWWP